MRIAFVKTLFEIAKKDKRIILITGDLGFSVFEEYIKTLPKQYLNAGISEQNMTGVAAGMALEGRIPIIYSIVPFVTMRNFEQVRNDICYQGLNVKIIGVGSGFSYGMYGHTHYGLEDVGILRTVPGITILAPGDPIEAEQATIAAYKTQGPVYLRLGKAGEPTVHKKKPDFEIGKGLTVREGKDIAILSMGSMLLTAMKVSELLKNKYSVKVVSMHTIKPLDEKLILTLSKTMHGIFTIEEHAKIGGLGSAVAEILSETGSRALFLRFGSPDKFSKFVGSQEFMREQNGLSADFIANKIKNLLVKRL